MADRIDLSEIRVIAFDAVGTLIYPCPPVAETYVDAVRRHCGTRLEDHVIRATVGAALKARSGTENLSTSEAAEREFWRDIVRELCLLPADAQAADAETLKASADQCFETLFTHFAMPENWRCFPDVSANLRSLRSLGYRIILASNFDSRLNRVQDGLPELNPIESTVISSLVGWRKPSPRFFQAVCDAAGVPAEQVLMIGDDRVNDFEGARQFGMQSILLTRTGPSADPSCFSSLDEIRSLLPGYGAESDG